MKNDDESKIFKDVVKFGDKKIYIEHHFTENKEDVRAKAADIILGQNKEFDCSNNFKK